MLPGVKKMAEGKKKKRVAAEVSLRKLEWSSCAVNCRGMGEYWVTDQVTSLETEFRGWKSPMYRKLSNDQDIKGNTPVIFKIQLNQYFFPPKISPGRRTTLIFSLTIPLIFNILYWLRFIMHGNEMVYAIHNLQRASFMKISNLHLYPF